MKKNVILTLLLVGGAESRSYQRYTYVIDPQYGEGKLVNTTTFTFSETIVGCCILCCIFCIVGIVTNSFASKDHDDDFQSQPEPSVIVMDVDRSPEQVPFLN